MKAVLPTEYGSRVRSLTVPTGFKLITRPLFGIMRPRQPILGTELAGEVVSVGKDVKRFGVGDSVLYRASQR